MSSARWLRPLGLLMVAVGLGLLAWVGWQLEGTTWMSRRTHQALVEDVTSGWSRGEQQVSAEQGTVSAVVRIPRFGESWAVPLLEGTDDDALAAGLGRFTSGAEPGQVGNFSLAGHRVTHGEPLRAMPELRPGDEVVVETARWTWTYELDTAGDALVVPFTETWVLDELPTNPEPGGTQPDQEPGQRLLTLTTCAELFHTDERLIAFGHLVGREETRR